MRDRPPAARRVLVLIAENRDKGSEIKVREVLVGGRIRERGGLHGERFAIAVVADIESRSRTAPHPIPPEARQLPAGVIRTQTTDDQMEMGNWVPAFKDIFLAAKGVFIADPLDIYTKYTGGARIRLQDSEEPGEATSPARRRIAQPILLDLFPEHSGRSGLSPDRGDGGRPDLKVRTRDGYYLAGKPE